jgi:hypothetical protein
LYYIDIPIATYFRFYLEINASWNNSRKQQKLLKISVQQFKKWLFTTCRISRRDFNLKDWVQEMKFDRMGCFTTCEDDVPDVKQDRAMK